MYWNTPNGMIYRASITPWNVDTVIDEKQVPEHLVKIARGLLSIGGEKVVMFFMDTDNYRLAKAELTRYDLPIELKKMRDSDCHNNTLRLWNKGRKIYKVVTGYGLSDDGIWRSHSWVIRNGDTLIETTIPRDIYVGVEYDWYDTNYRYRTYIRGESIFY